MWVSPHLSPTSLWRMLRSMTAFQIVDDGRFIIKVGCWLPGVVVLGEILPAHMILVAVIQSAMVDDGVERLLGRNWQQVMVATPCNVVALAGKTLSANSLDLAWEVGPIVSCFANGI